MKWIFNRHMIGVFIVGVVITLSVYLNVMQYLSISYIVNNMNMLKSLVTDYYSWSVGCYIICFILASICCLPGSSIFTIIAGLLFGVIPGVFYAIIASIIGSSILFLSARYLIGDWIQERYKDRLDVINNDIAWYGYYYLSIIRLVALLPFSLVTILSSLTLLPFGIFMRSTLLGMIPMSLLYTFFGSQLAHVQSGEDIVSGSLLFIIIKIIILPLLIKAMRRVKTRSVGRQPMIIN